MPVVTPDIQLKTLLGQAQKLEDDALALVLSDNCTAEQVAQAEQMHVDAAVMKSRASTLTKLQLEREAPLPEANPDRSPSTFKNGREFWGAVAAVVLTKGRQVDPRLKEYNAADFAGADTKALSSQTGSTGGFLLPSTQNSEIMSLSAPMSVVRPRATVIPMSTRSVTMPTLDQTGTDAADHFFAGMKAYWTEEGGTLTASNPLFGLMELVARELSVYTEIPNSLLRDAKALAAFLESNRGFPGAVAQAEDRAFLKGNGVGKPIGVLDANCGATKAVTRNTTSHIKYDDLARMKAGFIGENPVWVASQSVMEELILMNGPSGNPSYVWGDATNGSPDRLLGHPIMFSTLLPALGTKGDIGLYDWSYYVIGDLEDATTLESSEHANFIQNRTQFRLIKRLMGQPWLTKYLTLEDGSTTLSPFVVVAA